MRNFHPAFETLDSTVIYSRKEINNFIQKFWGRQLYRGIANNSEELFQKKNIHGIWSDIGYHY